MDLGIAGKTAIVAASSQGLGFASAAALAHEGVNLTICARREGPLREAEQQLSALGVRVLAVPIDITDAGAPDRLAGMSIDFHGRLDIAVANAGGPPPGRSLDVDDEALLDAVNQNLLTSTRMVRACAGPMRERGWGRICLIASFSVFEPIPQLALSNTARSGLLAWAKTAAVDLAPDGVILNIACPGLHATERVRALGQSAPGGATGDPSDFGSVVAFLCSEHAAALSGAAIPIDGGATALAR